MKVGAGNILDEKLDLCVGAVAACELLTDPGPALQLSATREAALQPALGLLQQGEPWVLGGHSFQPLRKSWRRQGKRQSLQHLKGIGGLQYTAG